MKDKIKKTILAHNKVIQSLNKNTSALKKIIEKIIDAMNLGGKIMICGNGGSAAEAQHMAAEFIGRFKRKRKAMAAVSLTTDTSILTSLGNDFGFNQIFVKQIEGLGKEHDILMLISTSGNSLNLVKAAQAARAKRIRTIAILGRNGGRLKKHVDLSLVVNCDDTARIQEAHSLIIHTICDLVEDYFA
jgi:D-sedoheptulose 7-phosphate isomerase